MSDRPRAPKIFARGAGVETLDISDYGWIDIYVGGRKFTIDVRDETLAVRALDPILISPRAPNEIKIPILETL